MPKYYCDYCDTYLTHDSPSVRKTHCSGRKHKDNVKFYYQKWVEDRAQSFIDATTAAFKAGKFSNQQPPQPGPFPGPPNAPKPGVMIPPPQNIQGPARQPAPGTRMPMVGPPPMGPMPGPMGGPMPIVGPTGPPVIVPGMRPPVAPMGPLMPMPVSAPGGMRAPLIIQP